MVHFQRKKKEKQPTQPTLSVKQGSSLTPLKKKKEKSNFLSVSIFLK